MSMLVRLSGITTVVRFEQFSTAPNSRLITPLDNTIFVTPEQSANANVVMA